MPLIFDVKRFSTHDGPGIRTTIFVKGCPLRCVWCHNPEGISPTPQRMFTPSKCIHCGDCGTLCPTGALKTAGREMTNDELLRLLSREEETVRQSGGGVTVSGGEPLMHPQYIFQLLDDIQRQLGYNRALDTSLHCPPDVAEEATEHCELMLVDLKHADPDKHKLYTGQTNELIIRNLYAVSRRKQSLWLRIPLIEGINADEANMQATAELISKLPNKPERVCLLPYHELGRSKRQRMGSPYNPRRRPMQAPSHHTKELWLSTLTEQGLRAQVGG